MTASDGKVYQTRLFNEDGIYEITFLSKTEKAKEFRAWVRKTLKSLRKGNTKLVSMSEYQKMIVQTRQENVKVRKANLWLKLATNYDGAYRQVLESYATKELTGDHIIPLPAIGKKTYSATDIANILETTPNKIGILSNRHNLKTNEYGEWFYDNAKHCKGKQVTSFRYYDNAIPILRQLLTD